MIEAGSPAPDFTLPRDGGGEITLSALRPNAVVLYFYPRDDTSGCTKQALAFTERMSEFDSSGARILAASKDTVAKHDRFRDKYDLGIPLLSDADTEICEAYGVWKEKQMYGRAFMGIERSTFLIDGDGVVQKVWRKVKVPGHVEDVLQAVRNL